MYEQLLDRYWALYVLAGSILDKDGFELVAEVGGFTFGQDLSSTVASHNCFGAGV